MMELKFQIVIEAYRNLELLIMSIAVDRMIDRTYDRQISSRIYVKINQCVLSLLTAVRSFHDQRSQDLTPVSTDENKYIARAKAIFSNIFDNNFDYRVMEAMRNYAQHNQIPIDTFSMRLATVETKAILSSQRETIDPKINLKDLVKNPSVRKKTRDEIIRKDIDWIDMKFSCRKYISCIVKGHNKIRNMISDDLSKSISLIKKADKKYRDSVQVASDAPVVHAYPEDRSDRENIFLGLDVIENLEKMIQLQPSGTQWSSKFVSSEVTSQHPKHPSLTS